MVRPITVSAFVPRHKYGIIHLMKIIVADDLPTSALDLLRAEGWTIDARSGRAPTELAGLDRHLGMLLRQSVQSADAAKQKTLYRDHYRFVARLNGCSTEACKEREYLARMGEISATMTAPAKPR